jgi:hypothetical protein
MTEVVRSTDGGVEVQGVGLPVLALLAAPDLPPSPSIDALLPDKKLAGSVDRQRVVYVQIARRSIPYACRTARQTTVAPAASAHSTHGTRMFQSEEARHLQTC